MISMEHQDFLVPWLCSRIGLEPTAGMRCIGSIDSTQTLVKGVVGFDGFNGASVLMHMAGEHPVWIDKAILYAAFDYAFNHLGCAQVLGMVPSGNAAALKLNARLGFKTVVELDGAHPDGSLFVMRMYKDDCKWLIPRRKH